jgi:hypothetical protein
MELTGDPLDPYGHIAQQVKDAAGRLRHYYSDDESNIRNLIAALMHLAAKRGQDPIEEVRLAIGYWYDLHVNPDHSAAGEPDHTVTITIRHKHSKLFEALSRVKPDPKPHNPSADNCNPR